MIAKDLLVLALLLLWAADCGWTTRVAPKLDFEESREFISNRDQSSKMVPNIRAVRVTTKVDTKNLGSPEAKSAASDSESDESDSESESSSSGSSSSSSSRSSSSSGSGSSSSDSSKSIGVRTDITFEVSNEVKNKSKGGDKGKRKNSEVEHSSKSSAEDDNASVPIFKGRPSANDVPRFKPRRPANDDEDEWSRFLPPHAPPPHVPSTHFRPTPASYWTTEAEPQYVHQRVHVHDGFKNTQPQFRTYVPYTVNDGWKPCFCDSSVRVKSRSPAGSSVDSKLDIPFKNKN